MAKKKKFSYKNLKVNEEELAITKIGEMPNANKSPIFIFFVFGILIVFIFFLPDIVQYIQPEDSTMINNPTSSESNPISEEIIQKELVYYDLNDSLSLDLEEGIKADRFKVSNNTLSFRITNNKISKFYFSKRNYFVELYTADKTLLERVILNKDSIAKDNSKDFNYSIKASTATNATKIVFVEKKVEDYPNVILTQNEDALETLTCIKNYETIVYKFKEEKLTSITDTVNYTRSGSELDYQTDLALWQNRVNTYNAIAGMSSSFISNDTGFIVNTVLDLANVKITSVDNVNYYEYGTLAKIVSFEMEARGFSCS